MDKKFRKSLKMNNLSNNTISAYTYAVRLFYKMYDSINKDNLLLFKAYLLDTNKAKTVNLRIQGINKYLHFLNKNELKLTSVKISTKKYLENVISNEDYVYFTNSLKKDKNYKWYFIIKFMTCTGARVSEVIHLKVEHLKSGYMDIYGKAGKTRRIYIPIHLAKEMIIWSDDTNIDSGHIFRNKNGYSITTRGIAHQIKKLSLKYNVNPIVVYPHSFRHRFAKNFIDKYKDLSLLADLLGHESIETTRIYLRRTALEQKQLVDEIVTW